MARKSKRLNHDTQEPSVTMPVYNVAIYIRISNEENIRNVVDAAASFCATPSLSASVWAFLLHSCS